MKGAKAKDGREVVSYKTAKTVDELVEFLAKPPPDPEDWGCDHCRNDGKLTALGVCPFCDAQYDIGAE